MNATIQGIIDHMFKDTADSAETRALHEELLNNCLEHYDDLIARGMSETEAIDAVVDSLKGMKEVIDEYPKKNGTFSAEAEETPKTVPEIRIDVPAQNSSPAKKPAEYTYDSAVIRKLKTDLKGCDLKIGRSADQRIHVHCEDMEQLICDQDGSTLSVRVQDKARKTIEDASLEMGSDDFSVKKLLNFVGKAISSVASGISVSWNIYIDLPETPLSEMDLNTKSGDIDMSAKMPERLTARSMSGDITVEALDGDPASVVTISAMSGEIELNGNADSVTLSSMSGDVEAYGIYQNADMKSTSGDVKLEGEAERIRMNSVSGDITAELRNATVRSIQAHTTSGDVDIDLPSGLDSIHTAMNSVSGSTSCSIPDSGAGARLQIQAKSVSGDVTIR